MERAWVPGHHSRTVKDTEFRTNRVLTNSPRTKSPLGDTEVPGTQYLICSNCREDMPIGCYLSNMASCVSHYISHYKCRPASIR